jgi:hypothetical protein
VVGLAVVAEWACEVINNKTKQIHARQFSDLDVFMSPSSIKI